MNLSSLNEETDYHSIRQAFITELKNLPPLQNKKAAEADITFIKKIQNKEIINSKGKIAEGAITIFPNPTTDILKIELNSLEEIDQLKWFISSLNGAGVMVKAGEFDLSESLEIDVSHLVAGTYNLTIFSEEKIGKTIQFIKIQF